MATEQIDQEQWGAFFTDLAKTHHGFEARLELISQELGDQEEASWLPFSGISYDPHHQQIFITVGGISSRYPVHLSHRVEAPSKVMVQRAADGTVSSIMVVSGDTTETLVTLRRQPQLAAS